MLAPYWSRIDRRVSFTNGPSKVFYHVYSNSTLGSNITLMKATNDVYRLLSRPLPTKFEASWVLVVTWEKLRPWELNAASPNLVLLVLLLTFLFL